MQYYYGVFSRSELYALLLRINGYPMRWLCHTHKRLRCSRKHNRDLLDRPTHGVPSVVDQDVDALVLAQGRSHDSLHGVGVGDV